MNNRFDILAGLIFVALVGGIWGAVLANAQEKPASPPATAEPKADPAPQVSAQDRQVVQALDVQRTGYAIAIAALQEKLDAVNAELGRTVQRLQAAHPGYELAQGLVYVVKKPEPSKKDTPQ